MVPRIGRKNVMSNARSGWQNPGAPALQTVMHCGRPWPVQRAIPARGKRLQHWNGGWFVAASVSAGASISHNSVTDRYNPKAEGPTCLEARDVPLMDTYSPPCAPGRVTSFRVVSLSASNPPVASSTTGRSDCCAPYSQSREIAGDMPEQIT